MRNISIYTVISVICLAVDVAGLWLLVRLGLAAALAGMLSYMLGLVLHYMLSVRHVFLPEGVLAAGARKRDRAGKHLGYFSGYFLTGLAGVAITGGIIAMGDVLASPLWVSKGVAVVVAFFAVYGMRKYAVFGGRG